MEDHLSKIGWMISSKRRWCPNGSLTDRRTDRSHIPTCETQGGCARRYDHRMALIAALARSDQRPLRRRFPKRGNYGEPAARIAAPNNYARTPPWWRKPVERVDQSYGRAARRPTPGFDSDSSRSDARGLWRRTPRRRAPIFRISWSPTGRLCGKQGCNPGSRIDPDMARLGPVVAARMRPTAPSRGLLSNTGITTHRP